MDLSKLPKLSQTSSASPPAQPAQPAPNPINYPSAGAPRSGSVAAEVWFSFALGLLFVYLGESFAHFLLATLTGQTFHTDVNWTTGPLAGQEVAYFQLSGYTAWTDASLFLIGLALIADGGMLLLSQRFRWMIWLAILITALAVMMNLITAGLTFSAGIMPLFSALAIVIGGYMLIYQWRALSSDSARA